MLLVIVLNFGDHRKKNEENYYPIEAIINLFLLVVSVVGVGGDKYAQVNLDYSS